MFVQVTNLHGFAIVDWEKRREVGRIKLPDVPCQNATTTASRARRRTDTDRTGRQDALVDE
jgi:hypothetical protein